MPRRKLKMTKAAIAARRRYRAKKSGAGRSVGAGRKIGGFLGSIRSIYGMNDGRRGIGGRIKKAKKKKVGAGILTGIDSRVLKKIKAILKNNSNFVKRKPWPKRKAGVITAKKKKKGSGWLEKIGRVKKCRTCSHRRRR